ncbi:hypothetical protein [Bacillus mycoides]|uniref:hypothetical protein n=1 Tax=Bacillus mycoides TaxID=1405 RepID=UPI003F64E634
MKLVHSEAHSFTLQWIGMGRFRLRMQSILLTGGGTTANKRFVHVELCETADYTKFKHSYDKYVAGSVDAGLGFIIDAKISVNDSYQYKVHNSHGQVFYITAIDTYVNVR